MNKIIIFGGAGFIGSKLTSLLDSYGFLVTVVDNFMFWENENEFKKSIQISKNVNTIKEDIREKTIKKIIKKDDIVINLACLANDSMSDYNSQYTLDVSYFGVMNVINSALEKKAKKIIQTSTTNVYGAMQGKIVDENTLEDPVTLYSKIKAEIDHYLNFLMKYKNVDITILRLATQYGFSKRLRTDIIINCFVKKIIDENSIFVHGGEQCRPFLHIDDTCIAFLKTIENEKSKNQLFNVVGENYSINEIVKIFQKIKPDLKINKQFIQDVKSFKVSNEKINKIIGFKPKKNIENELPFLFELFQNEKINWSKTINTNVLKQKFKND